MNVNFKYSEPGANDPIIFEQVFAEKPGGGMVPNPSFDLLPGTAIGLNSDGKYAPIKAFRVVEDAESSATSIKIAKGSGVAVNDIIATGKTGVKCTAIDTTTSTEYDIVTVSLGVAVKKGQVLYQSAVESAAATQSDPAVDAYPIYVPLYLIYARVFAGEGDQRVRFVNGANIRKETAPVADEVVALMSGIHKV